MPHAVDPDDLQEQQDDAEIARLLSNTQRPDGGGELDFFTRDLEVGEKADDAEDFEDIGDDDLASEEEDGDQRARTDGERSANGHSSPLQEGLSDPYTQEIDFGDDLFGDDDATAPTEQPPDQATAHQPTPGLSLALPSKSGIALPTNGLLPPSGPQAPVAAGRSSVQFPTSSAIPEPHVDGDEEDGQTVRIKEEDADEGVVVGEDEEELDKDAKLQRELFAMAGRRGSTDLPDAPQSEMEAFYSIWPTYEPDKTPRFTELFPPTRGFFNWKAPAKPPKPIQPIKVSLELLQDTERSFRLSTGGATNKNARMQDHEAKGIFYTALPRSEEQETDSGIEFDEIDENEQIGGVSFRDIALICEDWDLSSTSSQQSSPKRSFKDVDSGLFMESSQDTQKDGSPPAKRQKQSKFDIREAAAVTQSLFALDDPEYATERLAKRVALDMNDPGLLIDEHVPRVQSKRPRLAGMRRDVKSGLARDMNRRYNISNDEAYELLKENHQHKVRSTLGSMSIEHSLPATRLQYPFYRVKLETRQLRSFHRPHLTNTRVGKEYRFLKPKKVKRKELKNMQTREIFAKTEDLSMADNSNGLLLEYSEEMPTMLSNFGMGNRLINYYRRKDEQDSSRPKEEIGETQVLLPQDRSPFANFGQVNPGELVPTIQNGLYRAPVFKHEPKTTDFLIISNSTLGSGPKFYLRNLENLHVVGQQFPSVEVPGEHSRKVTSAAKDRLKAISYRVWRNYEEKRSRQPLTNLVVQAHLPGSDIAQNRGKMREFMQYDKNNQIWIPKAGGPDMTPEQIRAPVKPEDVCTLDAMQVGVQHLTDLGLRRDEDVNDDDDEKEGANIELLLAPWATTKNFLNACQGKAMLQLHGEGDPTGRGEGFSFIKTSMKGGFRALGESIEERLDAKRLKENNGHSYNVARQQRAYDESIRRIWRAQQESLSSTMDHDEAEVDIDDEPEDDIQRAATPRTATGTPASYIRREDESVSQFSRASTGRNQTLIITRKQRDKYGMMEEVPITLTNPRVIAAYKKAKYRAHTKQIDPLSIRRTGDKDLDAAQLRAAEEELARLEKNVERREARDRAKGIVYSPSAANSPAADGDDGNAAPQAPTGKRGRKKPPAEGTGRRCANCGQIGHIKTNKKLCPMLNGTMKPEDIQTGFATGAAGGEPADNNLGSSDANGGGGGGSGAGGFGGTGGRAGGDGGGGGFGGAGGNADFGMMGMDM